MIQFFFQSRFRSFKYALAGLRYVLRTQKNAWIHSVTTIVVIILAAYLQIALHDWAILFLTIGMVWTAEFINTALEVVVDLASPQNHPLAKVGKDVGAAAVLIAASIAVVIGLLILGPPLFKKVF